MIIFIALAGAFAGLTQVWLSLPYLSVILYIPLFYSTVADKALYSGRIRILRKIKSTHIFVFACKTVTCSFLITVYKLMSMPAFVGIAICILVTLALSLWLTFLTCLPICFLEKIHSGKYSNIISLSVLYTLGEWLCENAPVLSFPWSTVALSVTDWSEILQTASVCGSKLLSLAILLINGFLAVGVFGKCGIKKICACVNVSVGILSACVIFGSYHIDSLQNSVKENGKAVNVLIAQDETEGKEKREYSADETAKRYLSIISDSITDSTDLILLPETAVPISYCEQSDEFSQLEDFAKLNDVTICTGAFCRLEDKTYNAVFAISPDGTTANPYCKQVLVPFGERIPLAWLFHKSTLSCCKSESLTMPIASGEYKIGCGICIESIYPSIFRKQSISGCDFFIVPTNDSWFGKSFAKNAHFRHSILRAVESGKYVLRSGNCGISAVISPWGETVCSLESSEKGAITATVTTQSTDTVYTKTGDGFLISIFAVWLAVKFLKADKA